MNHATFRGLLCAALLCGALAAALSSTHGKPSALRTSPLHPSRGGVRGVDAPAKKSSGYRVWRLTCSQGSDRRRICLAFVSVEPTRFDRPGMLALSKELGRKYRHEPRVHFYLFDDAVLARGHATGSFEMRDLPRNMRGQYFFDKPGDAEHIKFSTAKGRPWDELTVTLRGQTPGKD